MGLIKVAEISIDKLEDRKTVTAILHENGYTVGPGKRKKTETGKQLDYYLKREEDLYCVFRIEKATEMYREECEKSGSEEAKRRYRELSMMYLDEKPYTVQEISEVENISDKTVYKDIGIACGIVAIYLLGADF